MVSLDLYYWCCSWLGPCQPSVGLLQTLQSSPQMCCLMLYFAIVLTLILWMFKQKLLTILELVQKDLVYILHRKFKKFLGRYLVSLWKLLLIFTHFSVILLPFHDHFRWGSERWRSPGMPSCRADTEFLGETYLLSCSRDERDSCNHGFEPLHPLLSLLCKFNEV